MARWLAGLAVAAVLGLAITPTATADQILQTSSDSLTTYKPSAATSVQDVRPMAVQRGVALDGRLRSSGSFPWAIQGNPYETSPVPESLQNLRLASGTYSVFEIDLSLPAAAEWCIGRTFNARQETSGAAHRDSNGYQGRNWFQTSQPELSFYDADSNPATLQAADLLYLVYGADRYVEFKRTGDNAETFRGVNGAAGVIERETGSPDVWVYYDQRGHRTYFFGDNTSSDRADWQLWKFVDPAGNTAYVGDSTTASTAVTSGYNTDRTISKAYDSAGRRYCYTYSTIDSATRLTLVVAETDAGGGWGGCGTETLVGMVEYEYYQTGDNTHGDDGNLKLVTITLPLSDGTETIERRRYYRYYKGEYDGTSNPGHPHTIKLALGFEGVRRSDWDLNGAIDDDFMAELDDDLKPYADAFFKYDTSYRVVSVFFNGECGCGSGSANGEHVLAYHDNPGFFGTSGYDTAWHRRVVITPPSGGAWVTQYFDEVGQPLSRAITDVSPTSTSPAPSTWVTQIVRNSSGQITELHSPANVTGYTHNTSGNPDGAITTSTTAGLVWYRERVSSGDATGFLQATRQKEGSSNLSTNSTYVMWIQYATRDLNIASGVNVTRPTITGSRAFHTAGTNHTTTANYDETTWTLGWWESSTTTDVLYIALKQETTSAPAVTNNGSGTATTTARYFRKDGTVAFTQSARGIVGYAGYTNGQITKLIEDADTDTGTSYPSGEHPNSNFGITSSTAGQHRVTSYTYDAQGRADETTLPSGRLMMEWYTKLPDDRLVTFSIPRVASYHGPAGYTVSNQAGQTEDCMTIAIDEEGTAIAPHEWLVAIETPPSDPIEAFDTDVGLIARLTSSRYGKTGTRLEERRVYFDIPASLSGAAEGTHYDAWRFGYDAMGRHVRTKEPSGTIARTVYDLLSRATARLIGTNDSSFPGGESSGTDDMVATATFVYDAGSDDANSHLTQQTVYVEDGTTGQRQTAFTYDYRGRRIVMTGPLAPFGVIKYDNLDRVVAVGLYSSSSGLNAATDPTTTTSNRVALEQQFFDERGQVWKTQYHEITQGTGADADTLLTLNWYDPDGQLIKTDGEQLIKVRYDRLGRAFQVFTLATDNDSSYSDVYDATNRYAAVGGDKVLEEYQVGLDEDTDRVLVEGVISREHGDTTTTGPLDTTYDGGDGLPLKFTAANVYGRIQIAAHWYDDLDRPRTMALYGTNDATDNVGTFDRSGLPEPAGSDANPTTRIVTKTVYNDDGTVLESVDALGRETRFLYDDAGRIVASIGNYTGGSLSSAVRDHDVYTRYVYTDWLQTRMWVDLDGDNAVDSDDQVTDYVYGTVAGTPGSGSPVQSAVGSGHLLREVVYPTQTALQSAADRTATYAYNAQGELVWQRDQDGNVVQTDFDLAGRETHRRVTTLDADFDGAVRRISTTYLLRGFIDKVTQYDNATVGSGNVVDDLRYDYDDWGNIAAFRQDVDSNLDSGAAGRAAFEVAYDYAKANPSSPNGRNTLRRTQADLPGSTQVSFVYSSTSGRLDDAVSRVSWVEVATSPSVPVASYEYLGLAQLVGTDLLQPSARWNLFEGATGTDPYPDLDRFGRVTDSRWTSYKGTGTRNFYSVSITHDAGSNITGVVDNVHKNSSGNRNFDVLYTLDALNRLTRADEGTLSSGSITNRSRDERWLDASGNLALSQTGNWLRRRLDLNGDGSFGGSGELDDTSTFNWANELETRDTNSNASVDFTFDYDKSGNQIDDGQHYTFVYDPFGRLRKVKNRTTTALVAEYRYNGFGMRIGWHTDVTSAGGDDAAPDGVVDGSDPWYWVCYDEAWRAVATFRGNDANPKEVFVHHAAGLDGYGDSSYIDDVILRDRDANTVWHEEADSTREERRFYCQNWRADTSAILTDTGKLVEWIKYSAHGVPRALPVGDTDSDGDWDSTDSSAITGTYDVRKDTDLDGDIDAADITHANSITGGYQTLGGGILSSYAVANRRGYAGYEYDPTFAGAGRHLYHTRHRVYDAGIGRMTRRDPMGYVDGMGLYTYVQGMAMIATDPWGLMTCVGGCKMPSPGPASRPGGGGGGPPACAGGTCGTPTVPGSGGSSRQPGIVCAGGACTTPVVSDPGSGGGSDPFVCAGGPCGIPPGCATSGGGGVGGGGTGHDPGGFVPGGGSGGGVGGGGAGGGGGDPADRIFKRWVAAGSVTPGSPCASQAQAGLAGCASGSKIDNKCVNQVAGKLALCMGNLTNPALLPVVGDCILDVAIGMGFGAGGTPVLVGGAAGGAYLSGLTTHPESAFARMAGHPSRRLMASSSVLALGNMRAFARALIGGTFFYPLAGIGVGAVACAVGVYTV